VYPFQQCDKGIQRKRNQYGKDKRNEQFLRVPQQNQQGERSKN
jgi:hypothetical protein